MHTRSPLPSSELVARWHAIQQGSYRVDSDWYELAGNGEVVPNPRPSAVHQAVVGHLAFQLSHQLGLLSAFGVPVVTSAGILCPDVVWMPMERWSDAVQSDPLIFPPDVCIEVLVASERPLDLPTRVGAYLSGGAKEVVVVSKDGDVRFWHQERESHVSRMGFSLRVDKYLLNARGRD